MIILSLSVSNLLISTSKAFFISVVVFLTSTLLFFCYFFELDSCHLSWSREECIIQSDTFLPSATLVPSKHIRHSFYPHPIAICLFMCLCSWTQLLSFIPSPSLLSGHRLRSSIKLALISWTLKSLKPRFEFPLCHLLTGQPWTNSLCCLLASQFAECSLSKVIRKNE